MNIQPSLIRPRKRHMSLIGLLAVTALGACAELDWNPLDPTFVPERIQAQLPPAQELSLTAETLQEIRPRHQELMLRDPYRLRRIAEWDNDITDAPKASLVLTYPLEEYANPALADPKDAISLWPGIAWRSIKYLQPFETRNSLGPARWRRFLMGGTSCVIFTQRLSAHIAGRENTLAGYYCAPPAVALSPGQAETVVQSVQIN